MGFFIKILFLLCNYIFQKISFSNLGTSLNPESFIKQFWNLQAPHNLNISIIKAPMTPLILLAKFLKFSILKNGDKSCSDQKPSLSIFKPNLISVGHFPTRIMNKHGLILFLPKIPIKVTHGYFS